MKWPDQNGSDPLSGIEYDPEIVFEDQSEYIDPIIVTGTWDWDRAVVTMTDEQRTLVEGIQVHTCPYAERGRIYVLDRLNVVDGEGLCLVCGEETT
jgi:hypothetical protein